MSTKEQVLKMLAQSPQGLSGQQLAMRLGVSRSAVWKAVNALKSQGYTIEGVTNRGYRLLKEADTLDPELISALSGARAEVFDCVPSTNLLAKERAACGAPHGTVIIANSQSAGRGRRGRSFVSGGLGLYLSIILRPETRLSDAPLSTAAAAVAVRRAIKDICQKDCGIKWVNDIYLDDKKVCGILTEAVTDMESGIIDSMVVGIGINFQGVSEDFPLDLRDKAGFVLSPGEGSASRNDLAAAVIRGVLTLTQNIEERKFMEDYRRYSTVLGQRIEYRKKGQLVVATAIEIDDNGGLSVLRDDGGRETISAGEVSVKKA